MTFLSIFKFCYTSKGFCTFFNLCSWTFFAHFGTLRFTADQEQKLKPWNHTFSPRDYGIVSSLTWNARKCNGVNDFGVSSFSEVKIMLPMEHGKQIFNKTSVFTAEVPLRDFRWRDLHCENNIFIRILIPTLHGKHNSEYVHCCPALLFSLWLHTAPNVHSRSCSVIAVKSTICHILVPR